MWVSVQVIRSTGSRHWKIRCRERAAGKGEGLLRTAALVTLMDMWVVVGW